jgi:hypothetical protein
MERDIQVKTTEKQRGNIQEVLSDYEEKRKKLHKMKILRQIYLEN